MSEQTLVATSVVVGYLIGSIPFGVIAARLGGLGDIRKIGSGNIGATNVLRSGRKDLALITLIGDGGKGALAVLVGWLLARGAGDADLFMACAGGAAFLGHLFSVWLRFKGGKGVATFLGVMFAAVWPAGLLCALTWLIMAYLFRTSSLAALTAAALAPLFVFVTKNLIVYEPYRLMLMALVMSILIFIKHHENIRRLLKGEEPKIGAGKTA
ncbi:glycerol-3-phosphate 1-O-acyltransferase PlsY [soil metagenome]